MITVAPLDLESVDEMCRLVLVAQRLGCAVKLTGASDELRALLDLAGVTGLLIERQPDLNINETDLRCPK